MDTAALLLAVLSMVCFRLLSPDQTPQRIWYAIPSGLPSLSTTPDRRCRRPVRPTSTPSSTSVRSTNPISFSRLALPRPTASGC